MAQIYESFGKLVYRKNGWATVFCCPDLARYYQAQIKEKPQLFQLPMHGSHITVVNGKWDKVVNPEFWKRYQNKKIRFTYSNKIIEDNRFWYLEVRCNFIHKIRKELGLTPLREHPQLRRGLHLTLARKMGK